MSNNLKVTKTGPSSTPWRIEVEGGPSHGLHVSRSYKTKREAEAVAEHLSRYPWEHVVPTIWDFKCDADTLIVAVVATELEAMAASLAVAQRKLEAYRIVSLHIDLKGPISQSAYRAALKEAERALAEGEVTSDPWESGS